jgi:hypothetical protein
MPAVRCIGCVAKGRLKEAGPQWSELMLSVSGPTSKYHNLLVIRCFVDESAVCQCVQTACEAAGWLRVPASAAV